MPVCNSPSCSCNAPPPEPSEVEKAIEFWKNATEAERRAFVYGVGGTVKGKQHGIDYWETAHVPM